MGRRDAPAHRLRPAAQGVRARLRPVPPVRGLHLLLSALPGRPGEPAPRRAGLPLRRLLSRRGSGGTQLRSRAAADPRTAQRQRRAALGLPGGRIVVSLAGGYGSLRPALRRRAWRTRLRGPARSRPRPAHGRGDAGPHGARRRAGQPVRHQPDRQCVPAHRRGEVPALGAGLSRRLDRARARQRRAAPGQRGPLRRGRRVYRRQVVRRGLRLELAARLLQRRSRGHRRRGQRLPARWRARATSICRVPRWTRSWPMARSARPGRSR